MICYFVITNSVLCFKPGPRMHRVADKDELAGVELEADRKR